MDRRDEKPILEDAGHYRGKEDETSIGSFGGRLALLPPVDHRELRIYDRIAHSVILPHSAAMRKSK